MIDYSEFDGIETAEDFYTDKYRALRNLKENDFVNNRAETLFSLFAGSITPNTVIVYPEQILYNRPDKIYKVGMDIHTYGNATEVDTETNNNHFGIDKFGFSFDLIELPNPMLLTFKSNLSETRTLQTLEELENYYEELKNSVRKSIYIGKENFREDVFFFNINSAIMYVGMCITELCKHTETQILLKNELYSDEYYKKVIRENKSVLNERVIVNAYEKIGKYSSAVYLPEQISLYNKGHVFSISTTEHPIPLYDDVVSTKIRIDYIERPKLYIEHQLSDPKVLFLDDEYDLAIYQSEEFKEHELCDVLVNSRKFKKYLKNKFEGSYYFGNITDALSFSLETLRSSYGV